MANINKIRISGSTFDIEDKNAAKTVTLTQAEYDALTVKDPNTFYVISDSEYSFDGYWTSAQTQSAITQSVSGKADTSAVTSVSDSLTAHTANTTVHVTAQDKTNWNNKSDFSGNYNDLTNKPTIPTVPTNVSDFTNDAGYITSDDISGKTNQSDFTAHTANTTVHVTSAEKATWNAKSDFSGDYNDLTNKLSAGTNVTIVDNVISAEGGSSITIDPSLDSGSTNPVANSAITTALNDTVKLTNQSTYYVNGFTNVVNRFYPIFHRFDIANQSNGNAWWFGKINDKYVITTGQTSISPSGLMDLQVIETSAITTSVTSSSTDSQVPSAKAVYDAIQEGGGSSYSAGDGIDITNDVISVTGKADTSAVTEVSNALTAHTADTTIHVTSAEKATWNAKSDFSGSYNDLTNKLSAGTNISIVDNVISAEGGSSVNVVQTTGTSTADVMSQDAVTSAINEKLQSVDFAATNWAGTGTTSLRKTVNGSSYTNYAFVASINQKPILSSDYQYVNKFSLVETSAITTAITSSSTDSQVPSAKAVNDKLGGLSIVKMTQSEYDALATKDSNTLYVING